MSQTIILNGEPRPYRPQSISEFLRDQGFDPARPALAIALNGRIVGAAEWPDTALQPGDRIELVQPLAGG